jgi:(p)ppGpp synthase/HD superfamily hydrolase
MTIYGYRILGVSVGSIWFDEFEKLMGGARRSAQFRYNPNYPTEEEALERELVRLQRLQVRGDRKVATEIVKLQNRIKVLRTLGTLEKGEKKKIERAKAERFAEMLKNDTEFGSF